MSALPPTQIAASSEGPDFAYPLPPPPTHLTRELSKRVGNELACCVKFWRRSASGEHAALSSKKKKIHGARTAVTDCVCRLLVFSFCFAFFFFCCSPRSSRLREIDFVAVCAKLQCSASRRTFCVTASCSVKQVGVLLVLYVAWLVVRAFVSN